MIDRDRIHGGFGGSLRSQMSPALQRRIAEEEAAEAREQAQLERERAQRAEDFQARNIQAGIVQALEAGQEYSPRMLRGETLGRTRQEAIQHYSSLQDVEDRRAEAAQRRAFNRWLAEQGELNSGDTSADTVLAQRAEEQRRQDQRARNQVRRGRDLRRNQVIQDARREALGDTTKLVAGLANAVARDRRGW